VIEPQPFDVLHEVLVDFSKPLITANSLLSVGIDGKVSAIHGAYQAVDPSAEVMTKPILLTIMLICLV